MDGGADVLRFDHRKGLALSWKWKEAAVGGIERYRVSFSFSSFLDDCHLAW